MGYEYSQFNGAGYNYQNQNPVVIKSTQFNGAGYIYHDGHEQVAI